MHFRQVLALHGPNIWANFPALEICVELPPDAPSTDQIPGFIERLTAIIPSLRDHRCVVGEPGGFLNQVRQGTNLAHVLEHLTNEIHSLAGPAIGFGRTLETDEPGVYRIIVRMREETYGRACLETAAQLLLAVWHDEDFDLSAVMPDLRDISDDLCLGPSTHAIVRAAEVREIPAHRLNTDSLVQMGHGIHQRRICAAETDQTSAIAESISCDKQLTKRLLQIVGVPVPEGRPVDDAEDAWKAACELGVPVVVKPRDGNHGRGVFIELYTQPEVERAYHRAREEGSGVLVERCAQGAEHRLLVVGGRVVAASRGDPVEVIGDGRLSVQELIDVINQDPRRGDDETAPLNKVRIDSMARVTIEQQGFTGDSVPPAGRHVMIQRNGNHAIDCTDQVHPQVAARAALAVKAVGLDIAGLDVIARDIGVPLEDQRGVVVEVNAGPGLAMHMYPSVGRPRPVGDAIVELLFPPGENGRVPVTGVIGPKAAEIARLITGWNSQRSHVGLALCDEVTVSGVGSTAQRVGNASQRRWILMHPLIESCVFEVENEETLREGLPFDRCGVAVINGLRGVQSEGQITFGDESVHRVLPRTLTSEGMLVVNADDAAALALAAQFEGHHLYYSRTLEQIGQATKEGAPAVWKKGTELVFHDGKREAGRITASPLLDPEVLLPAISAAWAAGASLDELQQALNYGSSTAAAG